jgi:NADPH:quinone reductase-like Zn-dependent oxidoreductase
MRHLAGVRFASIGSNRRAAFFVAKLKKEDLRLLADLLEAGRLAPVIDRSYPLRQVPEALRYMGEGHARGKIVIVHA